MIAHAMARSPNAHEAGVLPSNGTGRTFLPGGGSSPGNRVGKTLKMGPSHARPLTNARQPESRWHLARGGLLRMSAVLRDASPGRVHRYAWLRDQRQPALTRRGAGSLGWILSVGGRQTVLQPARTVIGSTKRLAAQSEDVRRGQKGRHQRRAGNAAVALPRAQPGRLVVPGAELLPEPRPDRDHQRRAVARAHPARGQRSSRVSLAA